MLNRNDASITETSSISRSVDLVDDMRVDVARAQKVGMQRMYFSIVDRVARSRQSLAEHLTAEHPLTADVAAFPSKNVVLDSLELEQVQ